ncbi:MAG: hypothetical protein OEX02_08665 [Cyclobacteriaceae bacterium]|nr:hypothetical protein [Cyclobacteriaceae bacterium]
MENKTYLALQRERNFGDKINATFEFIKQNFKPLMTSLLYIPGPLIAISAVFYVMFMDDYFRNIGGAIQGGTDFSFDFIGYMVAFMVVSGLSYVLLTVVILEYVNIYNERKDAVISVEEVWARTKKSFSGAFGATFLLFLTYIAFVGVFGFFFVIMARGQAGGMVALSAFLLIFVVIYLVISLSLFFNILINEKRSVGQFIEILKRCFFLIKGKWWSTFGLIIIVSLIRSSITGILQIPVGASQIAQLIPAIMNEQVPTAEMIQQAPWQIAYQAIVFIIGTLLNIIVVVAITFQYFNLVERRESAGLMEQIRQVGDTGTKSSTNDAEHDEDY